MHEPSTLEQIIALVIAFGLPTGFVAYIFIRARRETRAADEAYWKSINGFPKHTKL